MFFVADENIDGPIVEMLREDHTVLYIAEEQAGIADDGVLALCEENSALLITADKDFGDLVFRQKKVHAGVILLRLEGLSSQQKAALVRTTISRHLEEMKNRFTVITKNTIRIRQSFSY